MDFEPENPFQSEQENIVDLLFQSELYYKPPCAYHTNPNSANLRRQASLLIKKYAATGARDPVIPYLAMTYFDLYVSSQGIPNIYRIELFVTCCFIVAWKMRKPHFRLPKFLIKYNLSYLIDEIEDLEVLIDRWLLNRYLDDIPMRHRNVKRPVTSFCFLDYLINLLTKLSENGKRYLKSFATHKLYALQYDIRYTAFKPSIVAAAAISFCVDKFYFENVTKDLLEAFLTCINLNKDTLKMAIIRAVPGLTVKIGDESSDNDNSVKSKERPESSGAQEKKQQQISALSSSLAAAQSQLRAAPDRSQGAHADTRRMVMPPADHRQGVVADAARMIPCTGIDVKMLPPADQNSAQSNSLVASLTESVLESPFPQSKPDHSSGAGKSLSQLIFSSDDDDDDYDDDDDKQLQAALSISLAESRKIVPPDRSPGEDTGTSSLTFSSVDDDDEIQLQAALSISFAESRKIIPPDRSPGEGTSTAQLTLSAPNGSPDARADTIRMMMRPQADRNPGARSDTTRMLIPPADRSQGTLADVRRVISASGIDFEKLPQLDHSSKICSLAAAYTQSVLDSIFPQSAPGLIPGADTTSRAQLMLSAPNGRPGSSADTTGVMMPPPDSSPGARADTRGMVMPPADRSVLADARRMISRTGINVEMSPPPDQNSALSDSFAAAYTQSVLESLFSQSAPDRIPGAGASLAQLVLSGTNGSPGARADTTRMVMPPPDSSPGARADTTRMVIPTRTPSELSPGGYTEVLPAPNRISRDAKGKGKLYPE